MIRFLRAYPATVMIIIVILLSACGMDDPSVEISREVVSEELLVNLDLDEYIVVPDSMLIGPQSLRFAHVAHHRISGREAV